MARTRQNLPFKPQTVDPIVRSYRQYFESLQKVAWPSREPANGSSCCPGGPVPGFVMDSLYRSALKLRLSGIITGRHGAIYNEFRRFQITSISHPLRRQTWRTCCFPLCTSA